MMTDASGWDVSRYRTYRFSPACHVLSFFPQSRKQEESFILWRTGVHVGKEFYCNYNSLPYARSVLNEMLVAIKV